MDTVREIFTDKDANLISSIYLSNEQMPDRLVWSESESGEFSVKTGYIVARKVLGKDIPIDASWLRVWEIIWKASVAPKVEFFAWRVMQGFLPVWSILNGRGIQVSNRCCMCGSSEETLCHVFFECRFSKKVWQLFNHKVVNFIESLWCFIDGWASLLLWLKDKDLIDDWLYVMWFLWNNRNQCLHKQSCRIPADLVRKAGRRKVDFCSKMTRTGNEGPV